MYTQPSNGFTCPLDSPKVYEGNGHLLSEISTLLFWFKPSNANLSEGVILQFAGVKPDNPGNIINVQFSFNEDLSKLIINSEALDQSEEIDLSAPNTDWCFYKILFSTLDKRVYVYLNDEKTPKGKSGAVLSKLNINIHDIYIGGTPGGLQAGVQGMISGFSLWKNIIQGNTLKLIAEWDQTDKAPLNRNGLNSKADVDSAFISSLLNIAEPSLNFGLDTKKILGNWVLSKSQADRVLMKLDDQGVKDHDHCVYKDPYYLCFVKAPNDSIHLITQFNQDFEYHSSKGNIHTFRFVLEECQIELIEKNLTVTIKGKAKTITDLTLRVTFPNDQSICGLYVKPERKEDALVNWGKLFNNQPSPMNSLMYGRDVTTEDPVKVDSFSSDQKGQIFRFPPNKSCWVDESISPDGAVPFGWMFFPNSNSFKTSRTTFISNAQDFEKAISRGQMWKGSSSDSSSYDVSVSGGYGGVSVSGSYGQSYEHGSSIENNSSVNQRTKEALTKDVLRSYDQSLTAIHDYVIDRPNVLLHGQPTEFDDLDNFNFAGTFWGEVNNLKGASEADFLSFIKTFGTHYIQSARYGARILTMHEFTEEITDYLVENGLTVGNSHSDESSSETRESASVGYAGNSVSISAKQGDSQSNEDAKTANDDQIEHANNLFKKDQVTQFIDGAQSEGSVDKDGAAQIRICFHPISELLIPPFFNDDYEILTEVRPKLQAAIEKYTNQKQNRISLNGQRQLLLEIRFPDKIFSEFFDETGQKVPISLPENWINGFGRNDGKPFDNCYFEFTYTLKCDIGNNESITEQIKSSGTLRGETLVYQPYFDDVNSQNRKMLESQKRLIKMFPAVHINHFSLEFSAKIDNQNNGVFTIAGKGDQFLFKLDGKQDQFGLSIDANTFSKILSYAKPTIYNAVSVNPVSTDNGDEFVGFNVPFDQFTVALRPISKSDILIHYGDWIIHSNKAFEDLHKFKSAYSGALKQAKAGLADYQKYLAAAAKQSDVVAKAKIQMQALRAIKNALSAVERKDWWWAPNPNTTEGFYYDSLLEFTVDQKRTALLKSQTDLLKSICSFTEVIINQMNWVPGSKIPILKYGPGNWALVGGPDYLSGINQSQDQWLGFGGYKTIQEMVDEVPADIVEKGKALEASLTSAIDHLNDTRNDINKFLGIKVN